MTRILIFGNSGSGKSTMARELSEVHGIPHLDLDTVAWASPGVRRPLDGSAAAIREFLDRNPDWVAEGCYADLLELMTPYASELRFLDPGVDRCIENCRARPWEPHKYETPQAQDRMLEFLVEWVRGYESRTDEYSRARHLAVFDGFNGPKVVFR
jgi:adenylate kinase family enzyme